MSRPHGSCTGDIGTILQGVDFAKMSGSLRPSDSCTTSKHLRSAWTRGETSVQRDHGHIEKGGPEFTRKAAEEWKTVSDAVRKEYDLAGRRQEA